MDCPKCHHEMESVRYGAGERQVSRCTNCFGIWFKPIDLKRLKQSYIADFIDKGDPEVGREYNKIDDIDCPVCGIRLDKVSDEKQTHIWYESCPQGHGVYFDAGELTDLNNETLMDHVRGWLTGQRPG